MDEFLRDVMLVFTPIIIMESMRKDRLKQQPEGDQEKKQVQEEDHRLQTALQSLGNIDPIKASIEFCVATRSWSYLFEDLQSRYLELGLGEEFVRDLEPFILQKRIVEPQLSNKTVNLLL